MIRIAALLALALSAVAAPAHAALPRALDGSWYNPLQSGHGLTIERVDHDSALLFWHVFDPAGRPLTLYSETTIDGNTMRGEALAPTGMRFGHFGEEELRLPSWGRLALTFTDCMHATLIYESHLAGYGRGEIPLTRLLPPAADCSLDAPGGLSALAGYAASGSIAGQYGIGANAESAVYGGLLQGFVTIGGGIALSGDAHVPAPGYNDFVLIGEPLPSAAGEARLSVRTFANGWLNHVLGLAAQFVYPSTRSDAFVLSLQTGTDHARGMLFAASIAPGMPSGEVEIHAGVGAGGTLRPGVYPFSMAAPGAIGPVFQLEVASDLTLCVRQLYASSSSLPTPASTCALTGRATPGVEHFEFQLVGANVTAGAAFNGVGQTRYCQVAQLLCTPHLLMIGDNGSTGLKISTGSLPN
jgi:hypothetical protein